MAFVSDILIILCVAISYFFWNYCRRRFFIRKAINLPGPRKVMKNFLHGTSNVLLDILPILGKIYPSPFQLSMHNKPIVVIYEPNQVKTVLQSQHCLEKNVLNKFAKEIFGMGLLTAPVIRILCSTGWTLPYFLGNFYKNSNSFIFGQTYWLNLPDFRFIQPEFFFSVQMFSYLSIWIQNRKIIVPSFSPNMLQGFFDIFIEQSLMLANKLERGGLHGKEISFQEHITKCASNIACSAMMGTKIESNIKDQYFKAVARLKEILRNRMHSILTQNNLLFFNVIFNLTALGREQRKILKSMDSIINKIVQQQLHKLNKLHTTETKTDTNRKTFFDILKKISFKKNFTQKMIRDNIVTFISMASDKISVTINFAVFMLANLPEIQEKVYKELSEIYGTETPMFAPVKYDDLQHMHYLDRVIKETMRLFPAVPIIGRQLTEDIKIDETILPKDTDVIIPFMLMYRNEKYWPNPLKFDPDRFLPERIKDCRSCYHIPFSDGPRNCIGIKYAMTSMKVILATLIRKFVFKADKSTEIDKIKLKMDLILSTVERLKIRIEKRD